VVGVVGQLQLEVLASRLKAEYGVPAGFDATRWDCVRWVVGNARELQRLADAVGSDVADDHHGAMVVFFSSDWRRRRAEEEWPAVRFLTVREHHAIG
jgi:peptide chain release factor 3